MSTANLLSQLEVNRKRQKPGGGYPALRVLPCALFTARAGHARAVKCLRRPCAPHSPIVSSRSLSLGSDFFFVSTGSSRAQQSRSAERSRKPVGVANISIDAIVRKQLLPH